MTRPEALPSPTYLGIEGRDLNSNVYLAHDQAIYPTNVRQHASANTASDVTSLYNPSRGDGMSLHRRQEFEVSVNTVRTQLQRIFDKAGARSQAALIRTLLATQNPTR